MQQLHYIFTLPFPTQHLQEGQVFSDIVGSAYYVAPVSSLEPFASDLAIPPRDDHQ
jgi:hypothetical protein